MRILIADGGPSTRFALCTLLEQHPGWIVAGEVSSCDQLLGQIDASFPDVLLLDWNLPGLKGVEIIPSLKEHYPKLAIIVMSGRPELKKQAYSAGADAFVSKTESPEKLLGTVSDFSSRMDGKSIS